MADRILTLRELNRATLGRQMLLERETLAVPAVLERLVGMQAQASIAPFVGMWTRLNDFKREDLATLIDDHSVVKATMMRATLHLVTTVDYLRFRMTLQPVLSGASESIVKDRGVTFDIDKILKAARDFINEKPRTFAEISAMLTELEPDVDIGSMRYTVRTRIPLVQVPISGGWSYPGNPSFTLAETWLKQKVDSQDYFRELVLRYLAAFGPASVTDIQTWSGFTKLKEAVESLKKDLRVYRDEGKREMFDLPDAVLPDADVPAPVRFLPEFDNLLLSHDKRTRVVANEHRKQVYLPGLRVAATFLVDGFVAGAWKVEKAKGTATLATLTMTPFVPLSKADQKALSDEAERLVRFVEAEAKTYVVRFAES